MKSHIALALALAGVLVTPNILAQTCNPNIRRSAPDARYIVNAQQGTVLDLRSGLIWKRCVEGQSGTSCEAGSPALLNWGAALRRAETSTFGGFKDWRIPNSKELESLVEVACYDPAINANMFPAHANGYYSVWASSTNYNASGAWSVEFVDGSSCNSHRCGSNAGAVRLVRGGQ